MERDTPDRASPGANLAAQANGRTTSPFSISSASRRRSLFGRPRSSGTNSQPASPAASSDLKPSSTDKTRIPRPAHQRPSQPRRPFTLSDAYKMAEEEEEAIQGSPSPAPRPWRPKRDPSKRSQKVGKQASVESPSHKRRSFKLPELRREDTVSSIDSLGSQSKGSDPSVSDFDEKLRRHALEQTSSEDLAQRGSGLFSKSRLGIKIAETAKELVRKTSRNSLNAESPSRVVKSSSSNGWLSRRLSGMRSDSSNRSSAQGLTDWEQDLQVPSKEPFEPGTTPPGRPATAPLDHPSPEKSFAWEADADFTAGDIQSSDSPPVSTGRGNTKIDEIRALEAAISKPIPESPPLPPRNTRIDEIRALELEAALNFPHSPPVVQEAGSDILIKEAEKEDRAQPGWQVSPLNTKVDDRRAQEIERLSKRALATARLGEIRERNAGYPSRSPSPEVVRKPSKELLRAFSPVGNRAREQEQAEYAITGETQSPPIDEAVIIDPAGSERDGQRDVFETRNIRNGVEDSRSNNDSSQGRDDSRDVLRRLALAANTSPVLGQKKSDLQPANVDNSPIIRDRAGREGGRQKRTDGAKTDVRPTVGFAGISRESSVESGSDKRSNFAHSDSDPTERIEQEMKLFAPADNYSERGSVRAPSPPLDDDDDDDDDEYKDMGETPRPAKPDPLTQATPRVMGAFIETPATIKVERPGIVATTTDSDRLQIESEPFTDRRDFGASLNIVVTGPDVDTHASSKSTLARGRQTSPTPQNPRHTLSARGDRKLGRSLSLSARRRRSKSLPRALSPLINSAKLPTVKDDLLEIQRANQFEDSTLDDFTNLLDAHEDDKDTVNQKIKPGQGGRHSSTTEELGAYNELEAFDRMSKSLMTGLIGIRTAKQGIQDLEDKVSHAETKERDTATKEPPSHSTHGSDGGSVCTTCQGHPPSEDASQAYIRLPLPRLWQKHPSFRFTFLGLVLFLLSLWYIVESTMCRLYCKPQFCLPGEVCDWSPDDPQWGYSAPVKLDQWITGGQGRALVHQVWPEVDDWLADIWDVTMGTDITTVDTSRYNWKQKCRHRRRLLKKGLTKPFVEHPEDKAKFNAWRAVRLAKEKADSAWEMGYHLAEDETMAADEKVWW
ncbi:hypothetical protein B0H67DRAFT_477497 [Lasiosphaeris hirsuta]|uniref:Uncharacterized protein n=1 Tax=Lasiosphaeris hirsuta TaxID=260670 RepID=A0AA40BAD9_9PEZI|nr:hypothetical protein B0H67DRAFT_477497 [Lasiosphaeris hirsuta]